MSTVPRAGSVQLVAGTKVVPNVNVTASTLIFLSNTSAGGTPGILYVSNINPGISFTITSSNSADTSLIAWQLIAPIQIDLLSNPPSTSPLVDTQSIVKNIPVIAPSFVDSGMSDNWIKWMQQITRAINSIIAAIGE